MKERKTRLKTLKALVTLLMQSRRKKRVTRSLVSLDRRRDDPLDEQLVYRMVTNQGPIQPESATAGIKLQYCTATSLSRVAPLAEELKQNP